LQAREVNQEEARAVLQVIEARLEFLRKLRLQIAQVARFGEEAKDVEREIKRQADEIEKVEGCIGCG
jgi:hypothetical protein